MRKNYYEILDIPKLATAKCIRKAYRQLALKYHPDKNKSKDAEERFKDIAMAYEVLSDPIKRKEYDESNLNDAGDQFKYDHFISYRRFSESYEHNKHPNKTFTDKEKNDKESYCGNTKKDTRPKLMKDPPIIKPIRICLEEILTGCNKKFKITRKTFKSDSFIMEETFLSVNIMPGSKAGTKITFEQEGDRNPNSIPADIVFVVEEKPHKHFERQGADILYTAKITLAQALCGYQLEIPTLENNYTLRNTKVTNPSSSWKLKGFGLPYSAKRPHRRGDLIISFEIQFPEFVPGRNKNKIKELLK